MKKAFALLMCTVMLVTAGCAEKSPVPEEKPSEPDTLRMVTDMGWMSKWYTGKTRIKDGNNALQQIIDYFGGTPNGLKVELEVLPTDDGEYQAALTHMRTEIMAGKGPDVFYLSCFGSCEDSLPINTLFLNPEHAMSSDFFLPLDEYIENAKFMEWDKLDKKVMEAGQYEGRQYILPMFYRLSMGVLHREADAESLPSDWQEAVSSGEEDIRRMYAQAVSRSTPGFRETVFGQIADNVGEELLLDKDELFQRTKEALMLYEQYPKVPSGSKTNSGMWYINYSDYSLYYLNGTEDPPKENTDFTFFAPKGTEGSVTAAIEHWCAVSSGTKHPEDAFSIIDMLLSEEFLSCRHFWNTKNSVSVDIPLLGCPGYGCIPVNTSILSTNKKRFKDCGIPQKQSAALANAREDITYAYITSNVDRELDHMFIELRDRIKKGEALTDDDIRRLTDKTHSTLKMMLAES